MRAVLFICTGNTCRSPMAEAIARHHIASGLLGGHDDVFVASAGVQAADGMAISQETLSSLSQLGIEHEGRSKRLTAQMVHKADLVFCMTASQQAAVRALVADSPDDLDKIVLLDPDRDIEDPVGMGQEAYDLLSKRFSKLVPQRLKEIIAGVANRSAS